MLAVTRMCVRLKPMHSLQVLQLTNLAVVSMPLVRVIGTLLSVAFRKSVHSGSTYRNPAHFSSRSHASRQPRDADVIGNVSCAAETSDPGFSMYEPGQASVTTVCFRGKSSASGGGVVVNRAAGTVAVASGGMGYTPVTWYTQSSSIEPSSSRHTSEPVL